ncbi:MAG: hypothetical protein KAS81_08595 [Anaerolineales bacterium]|nr:hypothetical protein [Anaerolineales bacterium]
MSGNDFLRPAREGAARRVRGAGTRVAWGTADEAGLRQVEEAAQIADSTASSWPRLTLVLIQPWRRSADPAFLFFFFDQPDAADLDRFELLRCGRQGWSDGTRFWLT